MLLSCWRRLALGLILEWQQEDLRHLPTDCQLMPQNRYFGSGVRGRELAQMNAQPDDVLGPRWDGPDNHSALAWAARP